MVETKLVVAGALAVPTLYFASVLLRAIASVSLSEGWNHILANVWATSGLLDYVIGLLFAAPYFWLRAPSLPTKLVVVTGVCFLGNVFSVAVFIAYIVRGHGTLREALLPLRKASPPMDSAAPSRLAFIVAALASMVFFVGYCVYCVSVQPISVGWAYIKADTWSYVTVIDVWTGICMVVTYVVVREFHDAKLFCSLLVVALIFLGNGATCFYLLYLALVRFPRGSLRDIFLLNEHILTEDAPLKRPEVSLS
ncbi:hypothetical protein SPRG_10603 [Saprolegnia parasitica CBS 223.65]|uniref:Uncharacterized protein n=1 Tax=Saprolegnia parasitica (strain CBS 223.65) TaxID=695850 RepID=A0A067C500_SAPPC|nr:hypothetical protein SPRG_10603 [Saprolegnia parasitica CBS 223.65]KDO24175.1 hypothetical protein SPRG_10603 [Saprolegnia parasitica CBS 223.65]|eukprot:XP_012205119.1 hypothetical protein SPRG_10603 [Saprolegnia parasitica CBS 223.65]